MNIYHSKADEFYRQYESVKAEEVHQNWIRLLDNVAPGKALDVGAGSGRDARFLAGRGFAVTAVEPADALREQAKKLSQQLPIQWLSDLLPGLPKVQALQQQFDLILLSAVWMHLSPDQRHQALPVLCNLLAHDGLLVVTLRHGSFNDGRQSYPVSSAELLQLNMQQQLTFDPLLITELSIDSLGRSDVLWQSVILKKTLNQNISGPLNCGSQVCKSTF